MGRHPVEWSHGNSLDRTGAESTDYDESEAHDLPDLARGADLTGAFRYGEHLEATRNVPASARCPRLFKSVVTAGRSRGYLTVVSHGDIAFPAPSSYRQIKSFSATQEDGTDRHPA